MKKLFLIIILLVLIPAIGFGQEGYIRSPGGSGSVSDTAYDATSWDGVTDVAPSKNAVRDKIEAPSPPTVQSVTCVSEGTGAHGALTITPTADRNRVYINLTVEDVHGCTITMAETGAVAGTIAHITNISAYHADFADQANILKLFGSPFAMAQNETITLLYTNSQWEEISRATSTLTGLTFGGFTASKPIESNADGNLIASTSDTKVDRIGATFDGGGSPILVNSIAYINVPYAVTAINTWTILCDVDSGTAGIIITPYKDAYSANTLPTTTMCTSGTIPHVDTGANKTNQAVWDCNITTLTAGDNVAFKVTTAPTVSTWCSITLKVTK